MLARQGPARLADPVGSLTFLILLATSLRPSLTFLPAVAMLSVRTIFASSVSITMVRSAQSLRFMSAVIVVVAALYLIYCLSSGASALYAAAGLLVSLWLAALSFAVAHIAEATERASWMPEEPE